MPPKDAADKVPALKGVAAENAIRDYIRKSNRPYGAADVSANIKNAVSKPATQKVLLALTEKGEITQKTYGKQTFFCADQSELEDLSGAEISALESELASATEQIKALTISNRNLALESTKLRLTPTTDELPILISNLEAELSAIETSLESYRAKFVLPSSEEVSKMEKDWNQWREEWKKRKTVFKRIWSSITESLSPTDAVDLAESLGIEIDSPEHDMLESSALCRSVPTILKRRTRR